MKRWKSGLSALLALALLCTALCGTAFAWDEETQALYDYVVEHGERQFGHGWYKESQELYDYLVEHGERIDYSSEDVGEETGSSQIMRADPYREKTQTFKYDLVIGGEAIAKLTVEVTGIYSQYDNEAEITDVYAVISGAGRNNFDGFSDIRNGCGYLAVGYKGDGYATFTYSISTNGRISDDASYNYDLM